MLDLRILQFNYKFLLDLESKRKVKCSSIRLKSEKRINPFEDRGVGGVYSKSFKTTSSLLKSYPSICCGLEGCEYGDVNLIENIYVENLTLPFPNRFKIYNISGSISIVDDFQLNGYNDEFYKSEIARFKQLMLEVFKDYYVSYLMFKKHIDDCYVDACYVDKNYNCGPEELRRRKLADAQLSDVFIEAGPDVYIYWPTDFVLRTFALNTDSFTPLLPGPTAQSGSSSIRWTATYDDELNEGTNTSKALLVENPTELYPVLIREEVGADERDKPVVNLTLTITWPWITLTDTRRVYIAYFVSGDYKAKKKECDDLATKYKTTRAEYFAIADQIKSVKKSMEILRIKWIDCQAAWNKSEAERIAKENYLKSRGE
tara:strand:+ start:1227 stop:2345 length:1119 start_codon:yes stop_codon:yes gene_type:complete